MKEICLSRFTKGAAVAVALATAVGCQSDAERFGYKGVDLEDQMNLTYLALSPTVTNWVPERVLTVFEKYDLTEDEKGVVKAAGVLMPGSNYATFPEGYQETTKEPWFSLWTKSVTSFGLDGTVGILAHYNEVRKEWETSESYFSSYWKTKDEALAALANIESQLATSHKVKMFHKFTDCWVAEYVRLCVIGVVGQRADGSWSCMLDIRDKCRSGCGAWEPVAQQQERLNQYVYMKELRAWNAELAQIWAKNAEVVAKLAAEKKLPGFENASEPIDGDGGRKYRFVSGDCEPLAVGASVETAIANLWTNKVQEVTKALGEKFTGEPMKETFGAADQCWRAVWRGSLYEVGLEIVMPAPRENTAAEGESPAPARGAWRIFYTEAAQPQMVFPPKPQLKK